MTWFSAAESSFLMAEAALNSGWNIPVASAEEAYNQGIILSFEEKGAVGVDAYLTDETSKPINYQNHVFSAHSNPAQSDITIKWDEGASKEKKIERIITQKWIALYPNGTEAWAEYRRTGYPKQFPMINNFSPDVDSNIGPRRIPFPPSEYLLNKANVEKAIGLLSEPFDGGGTALWWDTKHKK